MFSSREIKIILYLFIKKRKIINKHFKRDDKLRLLQGNYYNIEKAINNMMEIITYREEHMPITLNENALKILHKGILYIHGRDRCFRPIMILRASVLSETLLNEPAEWKEDILRIWLYVSLYTIDNLLVPGRWENWISVNDLGDVATTKIPVKFWIEMANFLQVHLKWRAHMCFGLSVNFAVRMIWKIISPFVDKRVVAR